MIAGGRKQMNFRDKIKKPAELAVILRVARNNGKRVIHCHGAFDLLHRGHVHQFEQARKLGDILVVSITADSFITTAKGPGRPVFNQNIRAEMLAVLGLVDYVTICNAPTAVNLIGLLRPNFFVKGASVGRGADFSGGLERQAVEKIGGKMHFTQEMEIHATPLLNAYIDPYPDHVLKFLEDFRRKYRPSGAIKFIDQLSKLKVLVLGEAVIDQYDYVEQLDKSPKGGVIASRYLQSEFYAGGSLACANHIANFCSKVKLVTCLGAVDSRESFIKKSLASNIQPAFLLRKNARTIIKRREVSRAYYQKHSETYFLDDIPLNDKEERELIKRMADIKDYDVVLVLDYGHGLITERIIDYLIKNVRFLAVSTQTNSANKGFHVITRYPPRIHYPCIDHYEARLALQDSRSPIEILAPKLKKMTGASTIAITLGAHGSLMLNDKETHIAPVFSKKIVDTVGAGDAYFSVTALAVSAGLPLDFTNFLGGVAGALATTYPGNEKSINKSMLLGFISSLLS